MCGICGFINSKCNQSSQEIIDAINAMTNTLFHRGPNSGDIWIDEPSGVALGHRRLSIIDLSPDGAQPMISHSGRYVAVFNGEIYNFLTLRKELESVGVVFKGNSDTEVMLAAIDTWGIMESTKRLVGMFAIAVWDQNKHRLHLLRDRLGEKPLYYGWNGNNFLFASELKALRAHKQFRSVINRDAIALFFRHNYIPTPFSIYEGIFKLPPGTILSLNFDKGRPIPDPVPYWSAREIAEEGTRQAFTGSELDVCNHLDNLLRKVIKSQMISDVPLGAFLSGGIDSSTVVAIMQQISDQPVKTFTIGFSEASYNEAENALQVARHLGTDHTELYVTPAQAMEVIPNLPQLYDEPFADSSQIPTYLVASLAKQKVTVSLSGDAGDELFGGYNRYFLGRSLWEKIKWVPTSLRKTGKIGLTTLSPSTWDKCLWIGGLGYFGQKHQITGDKIHKLAEILAVDSPEAMYHCLVSHWKDPTSLVLESNEPLTLLTDAARWANLNDFTQRMMFLDLITYLPDDILVKVDRASMGVSLESRIPFLDHRVVDFAWHLPLHMKVRNGQGKWILRQVLYRYVPKKLIERPKMGFGVPIDSWLRGPLRDWAEALLDPIKIKQEGYLEPEPLQTKWREHLSGRRNWQYHLWDALMFEAWCDNQKQIL